MKDKGPLSSSSTETAFPCFLTPSHFCQGYLWGSENGDTTNPALGDKTVVSLHPLSDPRLSHVQ